MRVYELAKQLGMENRELIPELKRLGIPVASHSSALDDDSVRVAIEKLSSKARAGEASAGHEGKKAGRAKEHGATHALVHEEPPKPDKKRILIKKKKEEGAEEAVAPLAAAEAVFAPAAPQGAEVPSVAAPEATAPEVVEAASPELAPVEPVVSQPPVAPVVEAVATKPAQVSVVTPTLPDAGAKKKSPAAEALESEAAAREKLKKAKKAPRTREEDEAKFKNDATRWGDLRAIPVQRREDRSKHIHHASPTEITKPRRKSVKLSAGVSVKEFAELIGQRPADVVRKLMEMGQMVTFNQSINLEAASLIAEEYGTKVEVSTEKAGEALLEEAAQSSGEEQAVPRPPVVTIMGHVDHGKTSLLDAIRQTKVAEGEAGGITQHIGAYMVGVRDKQVTFLDTPGHEAFTAMRARGAKATDIVILVVAADDGVMPQTVEAIHHAKAAGVPLIVAVNKVDKPGANVDRVKNALTEHGLVPEAWGGDTIMVEVSAKQRTGLEQLLEMILLQAEVLELKADPTRMAKGLVIEAKLDRGRGPIATVLVQSGTLHVGDAFVVGNFSGRVRALITDTGRKTTEAGPSVPVEVIGLPGVPSAGDVFTIVKDERVAREIAQERAMKQRAAELAGPAKVSLDDLFAKIQEGNVKELPIVIKADVQGSAEALAAAVEKMPAGAVKLRVMHTGVGGITETDVLLAAASKAIVIGFNIRPEPKAASLAEREGVDVRLYSIIYDALNDIRAAMEGLLEPTLKERVLGRVEVRQMFTIPKAGLVAGCYVVDGVISRASAGVRVIRDSVVVYEGKLGSLRRFKDDVREVQQGYECGVTVENFNDLKAGDIIEAFAIDKVAAKLEPVNRGAAPSHRA
ncbi:MAG: translation initiation factor IF-2 [Nitrospira sp.]|nr:translation initiation factor IF-2 [Nitrospira sp.]MBS0163795.1 translation initiation factor IF-2 [Nitrospira sp.]MBS0176428.1 translation initiation factor IF-2 [Nitrospira sp.]MBX3338161.1 translation initiation factor IF-2 [Nitrospira sp.]MCW5779286.1 translation initiation factor IF-2 [Nitrospira sp.]